MSITIYDIAEQAGVSIATVSRVFSGSARVADRTRERVFRVAGELGYEPNVSARSLARRSTQVVSMVLPTMTSFFFSEVIRGVQDGLAEAEFDLLVYAGQSPDSVDAQIERALQSGRADGLLAASFPLTRQRVERLMSCSTPVVLVDALHPDFDSVAVNNTEGGFTAGRHLLEAGYRRIGMILPHPEPAPGRERRDGFERALRQAGQRIDPALVFVSSDLERHGFTMDAGYVGMQTLLARSERPDAVFAACDEQALGAIKAIQDAGLRCPDDIAVIGFDDIQTSAFVGLSTLRQPMYDIGRAGAEKLLRRIEDPERPVSHTVFSARLVQRDTTACSRQPGACVPAAAAAPPETALPIT